MDGCGTTTLLERAFLLARQYPQNNAPPRTATQERKLACLDGSIHMSILAHKHTSRLLPSPAPRMSSHMSSHCSVPAGPRWCRPPRLHTSCGPEAIQFRRPGPARRALRGAGARASAGPQVEFMPYTLIKKSDQYDLRLMRCGVRWFT